MKQPIDIHFFLVDHQTRSLREALASLDLNILLLQ